MVRLPAHPRAGGENRAVIVVGGGVNGSSPRWRGKPGRKPTRGYLQRLIPALAGKTT